MPPVAITSVMPTPTMTMVADLREIDIKRLDRDAKCLREGETLKAINAKSADQRTHNAAT